MSTIWIDGDDTYANGGNVNYCPTCIDVYGQIGNRIKRCECCASDGLPESAGWSDFPTPFEICWYCQAEIIRSGSKWATYYCEGCRPTVLELNARLDAIGKVSLPVGRHSQMHTRWSNARPFTTSPVVWQWRQDRLARAWTDYARPILEVRDDEPSRGPGHAQGCSLHPTTNASTEWVDFSSHVRDFAEFTQWKTLLGLAAEVQGVAPDQLMEALNKVNGSAPRRGFIL